MHLIIIAVVIVSVIGLIAGLGLAVASKVMAVPVDEKAEEIQAALPGANCGACGFSGCSGYAAALSQGKTTDTGRCMPGGAEVSKAIAKITGLAAGDVVPMTAVVLCQGNMHNTDTKLNYVGVKSCKWQLSFSADRKSASTAASASATALRYVPMTRFISARALRE